MILDLEPDDELEDNPNQSDLVRRFFDFAILLFCWNESYGLALQ
jgi:hypothetical protein